MEIDLEMARHIGQHCEDNSIASYIAAHARRDLVSTRRTLHASGN